MRVPYILFNLVHLQGLIIYSTCGVVIIIGRNLIRFLKDIVAILVMITK